MAVVSALLGGAVIAAAVSGLVSWWLQRQMLTQQRALHVHDRRSEAYATFLTAAANRAISVGTLGDIFHAVLQGAPPPDSQFMEERYREVWAAMDAFGMAQHRAALVAGDDLVKLIERISANAYEMADVQRECQSDLAAHDRLNQLGAQAITLRNQFLAESRKELAALLRAKPGGDS